MSSLIGSIIAAVVGAVLTALLSYFKKPSEQAQKEADDEKNKKYLDAVNSNSDGFILPPDAVNDKWGATIAEVEPRVESSKTDATQR